MSQDDQGISADNSVDVHLKRKRGRPRKVSKLNYDENILITQNKGKQHMEAMPTSPGSGVNGSQTHPAIKIQKVADGMLGQVVSGVIEAVFEAGYLLCVKVGDSGLTLRGVVLKPGCYVPVSAENDLAPEAQMFQRNTIPFATGNETNGNHPVSKNEEVVPSHESSGAKLEFKCTPPHSSLDVSKDKSMSSMFGQISASESSRGTVIPFVLQPAKLTNGPGLSVAATESLTIQTADIQSSKGQEVLVDTPAANETVTVGMESFPFPTQSSEQQVLQDVVSVENSSHNPSFVLEVHDSEGKSTTLPSTTPFDSIVSEVIKRIQAPPLLAKMETENDKPTGFSLLAKMETENDKPTGKTSSAKECEDTAEVEGNIADGPYMVEPLIAVQPLDASSVPVPKAPDEESRTGKMTELLQENMMQTSEPWAETQNPDLIIKSDEHEESKTGIGEEGAANQNQI